MPYVQWLLTQQRTVAQIVNLMFKPNKSPGQVHAWDSLGTGTNRNGTD